MDWIQVFQQLGFPVAATISLGYVLMKVTIFFGERIYIPLQEKHFSLVQKLESSLDTVNTAQIDLVQSQRKILELIQLLSNNLKDLENRLNSVETKV
jgi:hypothetical protein